MNILDKLHVNPRLETTLIVQIKEQFTWLIASGQIQPGELLPSVRKMAAYLSINLHTVRHAYERLETQGLVETRKGVGTRVLPYNPQSFISLGAKSSSHMVGVIIPSMSNPLYTQYIRGIEQISRPQHTMLLICEHHDEPEEALSCFRRLSEKGVDGILAFSFSLSEYLPTEDQRGDTSLTIPYVTIDWHGKESYTVLCDLQDGGYQAVEHLLINGHSRIGLIPYALDIPAVKQMQAGYQHALADNGIALDKTLVAPVHGFDLDAGEEAARALLGLPKPPTAIFAMSDLLAIGALSAIRAAGLSVPQDIALVGINDIPLARLVEPPLTTVHQPSYEMGQAAMKMLQSLIAGIHPPERQVLLPMTLVVRESSGRSII